MGHIERETASHLLSKAEKLDAEYDRKIDTDLTVGDPLRLIHDYAGAKAVAHIVMRYLGEWRTVDPWSVARSEWHL